LIHSSFQDYQSTEKFDIIVCNPPFFSSSKLGESDDQNLARHQIFFSPFDFIKFSSIHISNKGVVAVIAPYEHYNKWLKPTLFFGMNLKRKCVVYPTPKSTPKRVLLEFTFDTVKTVETSLVIEQKRHFYTSETAALLKDFYLKL
jgi:tRNA1Val (adenine37-N6)-methyltransferase